MTYVLTSNMRQGLNKLNKSKLCCLVTSYDFDKKTRPAHKLLVRVKFTVNPYSYQCERPPLKCMQTRVV